MPVASDGSSGSADEAPREQPAASPAAARPPSAGASAAAKRRKKKKKGGGNAAESADQAAQPDGLGKEEDLDSILAELNLTQAGTRKADPHPQAQRLQGRFARVDVTM